MIENETSDEIIEATEFFREYIEKVKWTFAKTMPSHPHWYTIRWDEPKLDKTFCDFAEFIRKYGYPEYFYRKKLYYFNIDDYKYWTMGNPITKKSTFILNRAETGGSCE